MSTNRNAQISIVSKDVTSYEQRLRAIGLQLDSEGFRRVVAMEVGGGFVVRATRPDTGQDIVLEFPDDDIPALIQEAMRARGDGIAVEDRPGGLFPTGYEDAFRAIGYLLDRRMARSVLVSESPTHLLITGQEPAEIDSELAYQPFERLLMPSAIEQLLDAAFRRRGHPAPDHLPATLSAS